MPTNKDFKRLIRARMEKTGESYTTARMQLVHASNLPVPRIQEFPARAPESKGPTALAALAGMSDASVKKATGCNWQRWVTALDYAGASDWSHRAIAEYVKHAYKTPAWWTQMVTVGYERIKGLRAKGHQRADGLEATRSKAIAASPARVYRAFTDARVRKTWLPGVKPAVRKSTPNRLVRLAWEDGTFVEVWLTGRAGTTTARVHHRKLSEKDDVHRRQMYWKSRLTELAQVLN